MPTIILSYRREDTAWIAGRVHDRLKGHFGEDNVFMDIDSIPFGLDFREHIQDSLDRCDILVAIVGPRWATPDEKGLRNLAFRQAAPVDSARDFHPDPRDGSAGKKKDPRITSTATTLDPDVEAKGKSSRANLYRVGRLLFSTRGRMSRGPFWVVVVATYPLMLAAALGLAFLYEAFSTTPVHDMPTICLLAVFLWLWVIAAVGVKRLHDRERPGHLMAAPIVLGSIIAVVIAAVYQSAAAILPAAGFVALLALVPLGFLKGTQGPNRCGPDPLAAKDPGAS